jgi:hypoxanthine phosphoribosyltransferase
MAELPDISEFEQITSAESLNKSVEAISQTIGNELKGQNWTALIVLKGSSLFASDLCRLLEPYLPSLTFEFISISTYKNALSPQAKPQFSWESESDWNNKNILIIEDIVDSGATLNFLSQNLISRGALRVECVSMTLKEGVTPSYNPRWNAILSPNRFLIGSGLDLAGKHRHLPGIWALRE